REGADLKAKVYLVDASGVVQGLREFGGTAERCGDLVHAAALSISIAIDPALGQAEPILETPPAGEVAPPAPPSPVPEASAAAPDRPEQPAPRKAAAAPHDRTQWMVGAGGVGAMGAAPAPTLGGSVYGSVRLRRASFTLEARADLPYTVDEPHYRFS